MAADRSIHTLETDVFDRDRDQAADLLLMAEKERKPVVQSTQRAAQASLEWFENIGMYAGQDPAQFAFNLLTRSRRITFENLRERDEDFAARIESEFARQAAVAMISQGDTASPGDTPDPDGPYPPRGAA